MPATPEPDSARRRPSSALPASHALLLRSAELLHAYGTPSHRLERVLSNFSRALGVEASFLSTPTAVVASMADPESAAGGSRTHLLRVEPGGIDLGKLVEFDQVLEDVEHGRASAAQGLEHLDAIAARGPRWSPLATLLAFALASAGAACFFGGSAQEVLVSGALGPMLYALERLLPRRTEDPGVQEPLAAFLVAFVALFLARRVVVMDDRVVTLSSLIVFLPGLSLTVAMIELATRHLVSGVARLAGAAVVFLTLLLGVALAWRLGDTLFPLVEPRFTHVTKLPGWSLWVALATAPLAFGVLLEARAREFGAIFVASALGFLAARYGAARLGPDLGPFLGALVVGLVSNLYARIADRPALVPLTPGTLLLVPGSLGYKSLTSFLDREALSGVEWAFQTGLVAVSLVGGLLVSNVLLPPRRVL